MAASNNQSLKQDAAQQIQAWQHYVEKPVPPVPPDAQHSDKDYRGIWSNPSEILRQLSGDIPFGHYGCGYSVDRPIGEDDVRQFRYLVALPESDLLTSHIRLVGPTGAGKSVALQRLVTNLALNHGWSIVWFSTMLPADLEFVDDLGCRYTVTSASNRSLTRLTKGRFNPLNRIPIRYGRVQPADCYKVAEALVKLVPIDNVTSDEVQKFIRHTSTMLAAILELLKYHYADQAPLQVTLDQVHQYWVVLASNASDSTHPLENLLQADCVPAEVRHRLRRDLAALLQPQTSENALIGVTAQELLSQFGFLSSLFSSDDIPNFGQLLRESPHVLIVDQSDGLNAALSQGLARAIFPFLYEELVTQSPRDWKDRNLRPVLVVVDEMNSVYQGSELTGFLEKARSKGIIFAFGQQSSVGNSDPHLNAAMSNNTRIQFLFSGCNSSDPLVQDFSAAAGRFSPTLDPHLQEPGFLGQERLPLDAILSLGPLATLIRIKSTTSRDQIMWVDQSNALVPHRSKLRATRNRLAQAIYDGHQQGASGAEIRELCYLYAHTKQLLLYSYGYWSTEELQTAFTSLDLQAIGQSYHRTMEAVKRHNEKRRAEMTLAQSSPEFLRGHMASLVLAQQEREWQMEVHRQQTLEDRRYGLAHQYEADLWNLFLRELPQVQQHRFFLDPDPIKAPKLRWWNGLFGVHFHDQVGSHAQAVLVKYQKYAEAFGRKSPGIWEMIEPLVRLRISGYAADVTLIAPSKLALDLPEIGNGKLSWLEQGHNK